MQIVSIGVYSHDGRLRRVDFRLGELNILTGRSGTGKSALLDIVEFCLGRDTVTIPTGVISDKSAWYATLIQIGGQRVLSCRPNPETASTSRAMIVIGNDSLGLPLSIDQLEVNADTDVVNDIFSERLGIERFVVDPDGGSLRHPFEVSSRQALFYSFQNQNEIANRDILFHRQADSDLKPSIRGALPYLLGAATPEQAAIQRQLVQARRSLQRILMELRAAQATEEQQSDRIYALVRAAVGLGILSDTDAVHAAARGRAILEQILQYQEPDTALTDPEVDQQQSELLEEAARLRTHLQDIDNQLSLMRRLASEKSDEDSELAIQTDRLRALNFMLPRSTQSTGSSGVCPLCDQELSRADETVADLQALLISLDIRLTKSRGSLARRGQLVEELVRMRRRSVDDLRQNAADLDAVANRSREIAEGKQRREQVAFLRGRVSQELQRGVQIAGGLGNLTNAERRARGQLARLEELWEANDPTELLRRTMDSIGELITDYARALRLEGSEHFSRLDPVNLTVSYLRPGGRVPLSRMGSAENWVGYHLATHLALHHWFVDEQRPTPRFLMLDQPTQAFFPEEIVDAAEDEDADWGAVRRQFELLRDVAQSLSGGLQIIVCDHANLADPWFQAAVVENWRNGLALIPDDWPTKDELNASS